MFDVGFWELAIIAVVALLVIGPERLPRVARTVGLWVGKGRRFVQNVKSDIDREMAADELKKVLAKQAEVPGLYDIIEETEQSLKESTTPPPGQSAQNQNLTDKSNDSAG